MYYIMVIAIVLILVILFLGFCFLLFTTHNKKGQTKSSFDIGETYEDKIESILNIIDCIEYKHMPKGAETPDFEISFILSGGFISKLIIEVKDVNTYSLSWERTLNKYMIDNQEFQSGLIISTQDKNQRVPGNGIWVSEINKNILITNEKHLKNIIEKKYKLLEDEIVMKSKLSIEDQRIQIDMENLINYENKIGSFINPFLLNCKSSLKKFRKDSSLFFNLKNIKKIKGSKYEELNISEINKIINEIEVKYEDLERELDF